MSETAGKFNAQIKQSHGLLDALTTYTAKFNILNEGVNNLSRTFEDFSRSGISASAPASDLRSRTGPQEDSAIRSTKKRANLRVIVEPYSDLS